MVTLPKHEEAERTVQYDVLRRAYDGAFREWVAQTNRQGSFTALDRDCGRALESSSTALQDLRGALVDFLMRRPRPLTTTESEVREAAYFIWLNAGRPAETAISDWIAAGQQMALPVAGRGHESRHLSSVKYASQA